MSLLKTINLEHGRPTAEEALKRLNAALETARHDGVRALKIIHGYGSSGVGGVLRDRVQKSLARRRNQQTIRFCIFGEKWNSYDDVAQQALRLYPELRRDSDFNRDNPGISIVVL